MPLRAQETHPLDKNDERRWVKVEDDEDWQLAARETNKSGIKSGILGRMVPFLFRGRVKAKEEAAKEEAEGMEGDPNVPWYHQDWDKRPSGSGELVSLAAGGKTRKHRKTRKSRKSRKSRKRTLRNLRKPRKPKKIRKSRKNRY